MKSVIRDMQIKTTLWNQNDTNQEALTTANVGERVQWLKLSKDCWWKYVSYGATTLEGHLGVSL